jgi:hypothetical protein
VTYMQKLPSRGLLSIYSVLQKEVALWKKLTVHNNPDREVQRLSSVLVPVASLLLLVLV